MGTKHRTTDRKKGVNHKAAALGIVAGIRTYEAITDNNDLTPLEQFFAAGISVVAGAMVAKLADSLEDNHPQAEAEPKTIDVEHTEV
ncbi:MAG: hypothetical protein F9K23_15875 [Bacteroidetes bacterium]|nr:MAG: hypothetical protein F9K23_15875 [Bacteroidota bacterium]